MKPLFCVVLGTLLSMLLAACGSMPPPDHSKYVPPVPVAYPPQPQLEPSGGIYTSYQNMSLFEDLKPRQVGDIVTVVLAEATTGTKSSDTSLDKKSSNLITDPVLAGKTRVIGKDSSLAFDLSTENTFAGESSSNQRNSLQGSVTVTVTEVLPGGNLLVRGEKWIHINQGNEYVRLEGIIRPVDITASNTILSTKVAEARISYGGTGAPAEVNGVGWLSRFFMSPLWPF